MEVVDGGLRVLIARRVYSRVMTRVIFSLLIALAALAAAPRAAWAQAAPRPVTQVLVLPFEADDALGSLGVGVSVALQRALNTLDGVYAPPLGDVLLASERAAAAGLDPEATVRRLFAADHVVSGSLAVDDGVLSVSVRVDDAEPRAARPRGTSGAQVARAVGDAALTLLPLDVSTSDRNAFDRILDATPANAALGVAALSASLLPGAQPEALEAAAQLEADSSWVQAEYARALAQTGRAADAVVHAQRAVELVSNDVEAWVVLGVAQTAAGDRAAARAAFERALQLNPVHPLAAVGLAELGPADGAPDGEALLEQAIAAYPRLLEAYVALARRADTPQRALQTLRRGQPALLDSSRFHQQVLRTVLDAGDASGAVAYLRDAAAQPLASSAGLYALAALLPPSQAQAALELVQQGRERFPDDPRLAVVASELLLDQNDPDAAEAALAPLLEARPEDPVLLNALAVVYARRGEVERARETFARIPEPSFDTELNLGILYLQAGQARAAREALAPLADARPQDAEVLAYYGLALARTGDRERAREVLERAIELAPEAELPQRALELLSQQRDLAGEAALELRGAAAEAFDRGLYALETLDYAAAAGAFGEVRETLADDVAGDAAALVDFYHGYALQRSGDVRAAVPAYERAAQALGDNATVVNNLGYAYLQLGRYDKALDTLRSATELDPENAQAQLNLGLTYYGLGRFSEALAAWDAAVALDPALEERLASVREAARRRAGQ